MEITLAAIDEHGTVVMVLTWPRDTQTPPLLRQVSGPSGSNSIELTLPRGEARDLETTLALLRTQPAGLTEEATPPPPSMVSKDDRGFAG